MSRKVCINFEVRNMAIMKDTLKQLGYNFNEQGENILQIMQPYAKIDNGTIKYDNMDTTRINKIKKNYMVNFYKDQAIREGMQIKEEVKSNGEVHLTLL